MYFVVIGIDCPDVQAMRVNLRPAHRERLRNPGEHPIVVRHGGPLLDSDGYMNGTMLIVEAPSKRSVELFLAEDPYCINNVFQEIKIHEWMWSLGGPDRV